jgi:hypothetical protein
LNDLVGLGSFMRKSNSARRVVSVAAILCIILACAVISQLNNGATVQQNPKSNPTVTPIGGNPSWDLVGTMILYRNDSKAGNQSYWVAQSFQVAKPSPSSVIVGLSIYIWLARDSKPDQSFQETLDNITVLLVRIINGTPDIHSPVSNLTIGPQNISAVGPYPRGLMETNSSLAVRLDFLASNPLVGFAEGNYAIFLYRENLGDNDDYHIGYAYYWAASKLDVYYGGGSWLLDSNETWTYYPIDMCFALAEITLP